MNAERILSAEQVDQFHRDGFLVVRGMYSAEETADHQRLDRRSGRLARSSGQVHDVFRGQPVRRLAHPVPDRKFRALPRGFFETDHRASYAAGSYPNCFGEESVLFKDKINFKLPGGDGFKEHQDVQAGWDDFRRHPHHGNDRDRRDQRGQRQPGNDRRHAQAGCAGLHVGAADRRRYRSR